MDEMQERFLEQFRALLGELSNGESDASEVDEKLWLLVEGYNAVKRIGAIERGN